MYDTSMIMTFWSKQSMLESLKIQNPAGRLVWDAGVFRWIEEASGAGKVDDWLICFKTMNRSSLCIHSPSWSFSRSQNVRWRIWLFHRTWSYCKLPYIYFLVETLIVLFDHTRSLGRLGLLLDGFLFGVNLCDIFCFIQGKYSVWFCELQFLHCCYVMQTG